MRNLKYSCIAFSVLLFVAAITGVGSVSATPDRISVAHIGIPLRAGAVAGALILAIFAYGVHARVPAAWKAGFIGLAVAYLGFVAESTVRLYRVTPVENFANFWLPTILVVLAGAAVAAYWGMWWRRQRPYFGKERLISG